MQESDIIEMLRKQHPSGADELITHYGPLMQYIIRCIRTAANPSKMKLGLKLAVPFLTTKLKL